MATPASNYECAMEVQSAISQVEQTLDQVVDTLRDIRSIHMAFLLMSFPATRVQEAFEFALNLHWRDKHPFPFEPKGGDA